MTQKLGKYFRLIDFNVYDQEKIKIVHDSDNDSVGSNGSGKKIHPRDQKFLIQMFGINEQGETVSITVDDYLPFFFVKVGDDWTNRDTAQFLQYIKAFKEITYLSDAIVSATLINRQKLYGFTAGKTYQFVHLTFKNTRCLNTVKNLWYTYDTERGRISTPLVFKSIKTELYESSIAPLLRYFHIQNISPSGWVRILTTSPRCITVDNKTTTCKYEYLASQKCVVPAPEKETRVPYKICSFDIEASSSHGDFPVPIKSYKRLATNIVDLFRSQDGMDDPARAAQLLEKALLTAFGYSTIDDIDLVYPIQAPSKEITKKLIAKLLKMKVADVVLDEKSARTIASMFEKKEDADTEGIADGNDSDAEEGDNETATYWKKKTTTVRVEKKLGIIDILLNPDLDRDTKVEETNKMLMSCGFPKLEGDKVTFIGSTFMRYGDSVPYLNHCLVLGTCDDVANAIIDCVDTEEELLLEWTQLIQRENPDIIIGYNIFGFDYEFMFRRAQENLCEREFLKFTRCIGEFSGKEIMDKQTRTVTDIDIESTKIAIASGEYDLRFFKMTGRLQIDMYSYFRRDFNLSSYKLDDVAGEFISDAVKKIVLDEETNTTKLYSQNLAGLQTDDFIHIEITGFSSDYYQDGKKFRVKNIEYNVETDDGKKYNVITISGLCSDIDLTKSIKWGMAKDDVSPQDIFRLTNGSSADRAIVAKYCIQDCNLVHHLMNKIDVITGYVEMSRICSVPISFLVFRGQGVKLTSYVAKKCRDKNTLMPDLEKLRTGDGYEGAIVLDPKCDMYMDNPVACVDYSSLYPSSMISQNYSHDSKVWMKEYDLEGKLLREVGEKDSSGKYVYDELPGYDYIHIEFDNFKYLRDPKRPKGKEVKTKVGKIVCCWAQLPDGQKSIMPSILEELLKARSDTRKQAKSEKDPFMQNILDKRQLGYKVTANSLYGQCGAKTSTFYEKDVAACTTATGRSMIIYAKKMIENIYGDRVYETACHGPVKCKAEYIYGDTDSVFFTFNLENPDTGEKIRGKPALEMTIEIAQDAAQLCSQFLKPPMDLAYEKTLMPFILLSKKRYVGMLYEEDPNKGKLKYMGLVLKRRDNCDLVKDIYGGVLNILMKENNIGKAIEFLNQSLTDLTHGKVSMDKLAITKALRSYYKNPQQIAHRVLADRMGKRDPGNKPKPGDRIKYVYICNPNKKALQGEKIEPPEYILENKIPLDYTYYITNQLMKPLLQFFGLALEKIWEHQCKGKTIREYKNDMAALHKETGTNMELFNKKKEKYCSAKIKSMLFDPFLTKIFNEQNGIRTMDSWFVKK